MNYVKEHFSEEEQSILSQYFTNTDLPVFGLINLPDTVKGALFARYSRSAKSLRRLFLDEFYSSKEGGIVLSDSNIKHERASTLYDKMILDFGDDSVAQLGGAHLACEQISNILAKYLEKGRLAAYLEQSTRYVYYHEKKNGRFHYLVPKEIENSAYAQEYTEKMDHLFSTYAQIQSELVPILKAKYPQAEDMPKGAWESTIKAKACDIIRGLLPASTQTNLGIFANGQYFEYLLVKMFSSDNQEVIEYARLMLQELRKMIPSFLTRVDLPNRGQVWSQYLKDNRERLQQATRNIPWKKTEAVQQDQVTLTHWDRNAEQTLCTHILYEYSGASLEECRAYAGSMDATAKKQLIHDYCGNRQNRRHKPGRAFESVSYEFDILSDYGAFRDLQRHRILSMEWQKITTRYGYFVPDFLKDYPHLLEMYTSALEQIQPLFEKLEAELGKEIAQYAVPFAYRMRYYIHMNLREAFHLIELRTQKQGHISYRKICMQMVEEMEKTAGHKALTEEMKFVDKNFYELSREDAEKRKALKK